ncbi:related to tripeptidyl-peptidase I [Phialocephala subalpina]|uniref:Related to tripeptidyl-peptidase I n=1 Tax=Phialocephala subalpina TaxID=576137 RepID=A0A1L7X4F2_9HELO|nr:related to tripeptidyl-peptidase I [Phialocephala subalpina]
MPDHELFEKNLYDISTPEHQDYGKHLDHEEVRKETEDIQALVNPEVAATEAVLSWLSKSRISDSDIEDNGEWMNFKVSIAKAETMLDTTFHFYTHTFDKTQSKVIRTLEYSLPTSVFPYVFMIHPTTRFGQPKAMSSTIFSIESQDDVQKDLNDTASPISFLDPAYNRTITPTWLRALYNIGDYQADPDAESLLGVAGTGGVGPLVPVLDQAIANESSNGPYLDFLDHALALPDCELPQTITTSYGENEQSVPEAISRTVCDKFGQLGLRGVSVLFSSGDEGPGSACMTNDGKNTTRFLPTFPGACPYITSVGGTRWKGLYNEKKGGVPDVAAQGYRFVIVEQNRSVEISGTSASSPAFAAVVSLLNNARLSEGKKPLGFLNPWLYSVGKKGLERYYEWRVYRLSGLQLGSGDGAETPDFQKLLAISSPRFELPRIEQ